jgi:multidrug efflux pump subunit AcrA (membrane-fusion protein)
VLTVGLVSLGLARLKPGAPHVDRATLWIDEVKRGPMLRAVHGIGSLTPEEVRWISAVTEARVENVMVRPGAPVTADTLLIEMSNPDLQLQAQDAESQLRAAQSQYEELRLRLQRERLDQEATLARVQAEQRQARAQANADKELAQSGLLADLTRQKSAIAADELDNRERIERQRLEFGAESMQAQLAAEKVQLDQRRATAELRRSQVKAMKVRAGSAGVLQELSVEIGQRVTPGLVLARVAEPSRLKAVLKIAETQARDVQVGQAVEVDTHNGVVAGRVARVDPAVVQGTVKVDVSLDGKLPKGARPDLSVDGTIEIERLSDVIYVGLPSQAAEDSKLSLFRLESESEAARVPVQLGRRSAQSIEVRAGLAPGDRVILSDMSRWDHADRVRLD